MVLYICLSNYGIHFESNYGIHFELAKLFFIVSCLKGLRGLYSGYLVVDQLCHTLLDYKPYADLTVEIRVQNLIRETLPNAKRGLHYA